MILDRLPPVGLAILGIGVLSGMDVLIKEIGGRYPTFQLVFLRYVFGFACAAIMWGILRPAMPSRAAIRINLMRGGIVAVTATTFFYALQTLPLAEAVALSFLSPLFLALFGALILGEVIGRFTIAGLAIGFFGMLVMVGGKGLSGEPPNLGGAAAAIGSAVSYAFALVLLRQRAQQDALMTIVGFQNLVPCFVLALPAFHVWVEPASGDLVIFALIGAMGLAGHALMGMAFRRAEASRLAIAEYSALIYAALLGFVFFGEVPGLPTLAGAGLIVAGTLLALRATSKGAVRLAEPPIEPGP